MKIEVLGVGGGFSPELGNSSFLVWDDKEYSAILMDCGFSVFPRLLQLETETNREIIRKIDTIFISHMHGDHVGSLGTLLQYRWFRLKMGTKLAGVDLSAFLSLEDSKEGFTGLNDSIETVPTKHIPGMPSVAGLANGVFYSGDTYVSVLNSGLAKKATVVVHDAALKPNSSHILIDDLAKSATFDILRKTWLIHYNPDDYDDLVKKAKFFQFAGVLTQGQVLKA